MELHRLTIDQIESDARSDREDRDITWWHCLRCLEEWEDDDAELAEAVEWDRVNAPPDCPVCVSEAQLGYLPEIWSGDWPVCCGCDRLYTEDACARDDWETSDMESPVCPVCIAEWAADGGGYYRCTGCGKEILARVPVSFMLHVTESGVECGKWERRDHQTDAVAPSSPSCVALAPFICVASDWGTHFIVGLGFSVAFVWLWAITKDMRRG